MFFQELRKAHLINKFNIPKSLDLLRDFTQERKEYHTRDIALLITFFLFSISPLWDFIMKGFLSLELSIILEILIILAIIICIGSLITVDNFLHLILNRKKYTFMHITTMLDQLNIHLDHTQSVRRIKYKRFRKKC